MRDLGVLVPQKHAHGVELHGQLVDRVLFRVLQIVAGGHVLAVGERRDEQHVALGVREQLQLPGGAGQGRADGVGHVVVGRDLGGELELTENGHLHGLGRTASPYKSAYVAAKHGIVGLTKTVALETAEQPITCNAICPGYVLTPLVEAQIPDTMKKYDMSRDDVVRNVLLERQPSKEFATTEQIGGTVAFLCSPAAEQITGTTISIDGGWTAL